MERVQGRFLCNVRHHGDLTRISWLRLEAVPGALRANQILRGPWDDHHSGFGTCEGKRQHSRSSSANKDRPRRTGTVRLLISASIAAAGDLGVASAAKQSGRLVVPALEAPIPFEQALASPGVNVMLDPSGSSELPEGDSLRLFIGPEGGWSDEELSAAREMGARVWSLGPRRLRAETAAIAACTLLILGRTA